MFRLIFAAAVLVSMGVGSRAEAQATVVDFNDGPETLSSSFVVLTGITSSASPRAIFGKVILSNSSGGTRDIECELAYGTSFDVAEVRLPAGGFATVALETANDPSSATVGFLQCRVISASTSGVTATFAKTITMTVTSVSANNDG